MNDGAAATLRFLLRVPGWILLFLLRFYQRVVSPLRGPTCRYYPSCSNYAVTAITRHGALRGAWLATRRLLRCHPWAAGGVDDVPPVPGPSTRPKVASAALTSSR